MKNARNSEMKSMLLFVGVVIIITFSIWGAMEVATNVGKVKKAAVGSGVNNKNTESAAKDSTVKKGAVEEVPLVGENFEVYRYRDPFAPLPSSIAPDENIKHNKSSTGGSTGGDSQSGNEKSTTAVSGSTDNVEVVKIINSNVSSKALVKINGKIKEVSEGQKLGNLQVINIDTVNKAVEFLEGDQRVVLFSTQ